MSRESNSLEATIADRIALALCAGAILFVLYGALVRPKPNPIQAGSPPAVDPNELPLSGVGFAKDAVEAAPPSTMNDVRGPLTLYGSHIGDDSSTGTVSTRWYQAVPVFYVFIAGFPNRPGNHLWLEVKTANAGTVRLQVAPFEDPAGMWLLKRMPLGQMQGAQAFRIFAVDGSTKKGEWVGFSQPFIDTRRVWPWLLRQMLLVILTAAAAIIGLLAAGLILRQKLQASGRLLSLIWVPVPGLLTLALIGVAAWVGPLYLSHIFGRRSPAVICREGLALVILFASYQLFRYPLSSYTRAIERKALLALLVLVAIAIGKSIYSLGPTGELFHDEISRTLEVGGRSDSRQPYFIPELIAMRSTPYSPFARELYETWTFSDRGPIAALASTPIILSGPVSILDHKPEEAWTIFDHRGFTAYRIAMIVIASSTLIFVFGLSQLFLSEEWALVAALVTMGSPLVIHDIYYTWPKLIAAAFVLLAVYLVWESRMFLAGLAVGIGYLCHPSALLFMPGVMGVLILSKPRKVVQWAWSAAYMFVGLLIFLILWRVINRGHYTQEQFLYFMYSAGDWPHTARYWLRYRLDTLLNTLVPLNVILFHASDQNINAVEGPSPSVVHFFMQPWCSVPFAAGIAYFFCLLRLMYVAVKKALWWLVLVFALPFLLFTAYMGIDSSGLPKQGLHAWFLGLMIFSIVIWSKFVPSQVFWKVCNWALLLRGIEVLLMMLLPSIWTRHEPVQAPFIGTDILALVIMLAGTGWLYGYTFSRVEALRKREPVKPLLAQGVPE